MGGGEGLGAERRPRLLVGRVRTVVPRLPLRTAETSEQGFGAVGLGPVMFLVQPTSLSRSLEFRSLGAVRVKNQA